MRCDNAECEYASGTEPNGCNVYDEDLTECQLFRMHSLVRELAGAIEEMMQTMIMPDVEQVYSDGQWRAWEQLLDKVPEDLR